MDEIFDMPLVEAPYLPDDEIWLLPSDLSEEFKQWQSLSIWQRFLLLRRLKKAVRDKRAVIFKLDTLVDPSNP